MSYDKVLRERVIRDFVRNNERAPTADEIRVGMADVRKKHVNLENRGFSALETTVPAFLSESSAEDERHNREAVDDDLKALTEQVSSLSLKLEDDYRNFRLRAQQIRRFAETLESMLNSYLLSIGSEDAFVGAAREDFTLAMTFPSENTTATIENGYCMARRDDLEKIDISRATVTFSPISNSKILSRTGTAPATSILALDGETYEYFVLTDRQRGSVDLVLTIEFQQPEDVGEIRIATTPMRVSGEETFTAFYSTDGTDFELLQPSARPLSTSSLLIPVSKTGVKSVRVVFNKKVADSRTTAFNQWAFVWQFDVIEVFRQSYATNSVYVFESDYNLGRQVLGVDGISKVALEVCTVEPPGTGIDWFVSSSSEGPWLPINPYKKALDIVSIRGLSLEGLGLLDAAKSQYVFLDPRAYQAAGVFDPNVKVFNTYATGSLQLRPSDIQLLLDTTEVGLVNNKSVGWHTNAKGNLETWVYVSSPEGKRLDLGPRGAKIDDRPVSGLAFLRQGWHKFETAADNYRPVDEGAVSEQNLRLIDTLYPYNHKYVVEGYEYATSYEGPRRYSGVDQRAGKVLRYQVPDQFDTSNDLWTWTLEPMPGFGTVILAKVDPTQSQILDGRALMTWRGAPPQGGGDDNETTKVYVRALLHTSTDGLTPLIDWFIIRGI